MTTALVGLKIRERRRALALTQTELAGRVGISPAYLNLIEFNKRRIGPVLLAKVAEQLKLDAGELDGVAERRLVGDVKALCADPELKSDQLEPEDAEAFVSRFPEWAGALARLHRANRTKSELIAALSDRLSHDPYLGDIVHQTLTHISAIRSTSEILHDVTDIDPQERDQFYRTLVNDSARLSDEAHALAQYFESAHLPDVAVSAAEEVDSVLLENENNFPSIESAAESRRLRAQGEHSKQPPVESNTPDPHVRQAIDDIIATYEARLGPVSSRRLTAMLEAYADDAIRLPAAEFQDSAIACRYDLDALAETWQVGFDRVCRRLAAISGRDLGGPPIAYMAANAAGQIVGRWPTADLPFPLYGAACPLLAIYRAFAAPGTTVRQLAEFPDGQVLLMVARARRTGKSRFGRMPDHISDMIALQAHLAGDLIYADGLEIASTGATEPVGPNCRLCPRTDCDHRSEDPLVGRLDP